MAVTTLPTLITKQDNFEIVRDQIALLIFDNAAAQFGLSGSDPLFKMRVFTEATNPWEQFLNMNPQTADLSPVVNVWYDSGTFDESKSDTVKRQHHDGIFNIDVYGAGISAEDGTGQDPGDRQAALTAQRGIRFVRNFLMASDNVVLQLPGLVWFRWPQSINLLQPELDNIAGVQIHAGQLSMRVGFNEFAPQGDESILLEEISVDINVGQNGMLFPAGVELDFTP